ncbi:MAG: hypothetical protein WC723_05195 [Candidatus Omnitrophota bacterium]
MPLPNICGIYNSYIKLSKDIAAAAAGMLGTISVNKRETNKGN